LFTHCLEIQEQKHVIDYYRDLLQCLHIYPDPTAYRPEVWSTAADRRFAAEVTESALARSKYLVAIAPGAGSPVRMWPPKYYAEVADYCMRHYQAMVVILGGASDIGLATQITAAMAQTPLNLAGKATFAQIGEILKRSHLFIGNDSGPMHLAAAAGVPVIALFSSGNYIHYAPYGHGHQIVRQDLPCYPCHGICVFPEPVCLTTIRPDAVIRRSRNILDPSFIV
jgi:ADP-heptose:LPS heptosyltransferase